MLRETIPDRQIESPDLKPYLERFKKEGPAKWGEVFADIGKFLNIEARYTQKGSESFEKNRERLNSEAGIVVANHPSSLDPCFVLPAIKRADLLMMLQRKRFPFFEETLGPKNIIRAPEGGTELKQVLKKVEEHISSGGLFILFPSGGEEISTGQLRFKSGFRSIISRMNPENMVYAFNIDPGLGKKIMNTVVGAPQNPNETSQLLAPELHVRPSAEHLVVPVDEAYSSAKEWQKQLEDERSSVPDGENDALKRHFEELFDR